MTERHIMQIGHRKERPMKHHMNVIAIFSPDGKRVLLCRRKKPPYQGLLNFVGGKLEPGEDGLTAAYRELFEETGITAQDIHLEHLMDFTYYVEDSLMEVYYGRLCRMVALQEEVNQLLWLDVDQDYADGTRFAGCGNLGHIVHLIQMYQRESQP